MRHAAHNISAFTALCLLVATAALIAAAPPRTKPPARAPKSKPVPVVVITGTLEASLGQPRVHVRLSDGKRILTAPPAIAALDDSPESSFLAFLDTGAGSHVLSKSTAQRFGVRADEKALFNEVGLHGATQVGVSIPYNIALSDSAGSPLDDVPSRFNQVQKEASFQLSRESPTGMMALAGDINVIGMPVIQKLIVEIDPSPMRGGDAILGNGPAVRLHESLPKNAKPDIEIPLEQIDFNQRKHPDNRPPLPALAPNPIITGITSTHGANSFTGDWLLDTGAAACIISTKHAQALGLYDATGKPTRPADFTLPLGGISGDVKPTDGFIIDRISIKARNGKTLEFRTVHLVVRDITATPDNGKPITLDGVFAMNLLLPSASGLGKGQVTASFPGGFDRIWINGPRATLSLDVR